jgi:hypothetical protein
LLVLSTLPDTVTLEDFEAAFWTFYRLRQDRFGFSTSSGDWQDALKQLDGSFISTRAVGSDIEVSFHSPSVRDFLEGFLADSEGDVADLISGAHFYEQYASLWTGRGGHRYAGVDKNRDEFLRQLGRALFGPSARIIRSVDEEGDAIGLNHRAPSNESRAEFVVRIADDLDNLAGDRFLNAVVENLRKLWEGGHADKEDLVSLIEVLTKRGLESDDATFIAAQKCLTLSNEFKLVDDFRAAARFVKKYPEAIGPTELGNIKSDFLEFASDYAVGWSDDDPDWLRQVASDLEFVAGNLEIDVSNFTIQLNEEADKIERERAETELDPEDYREEWEPSSYRDDVNDMFQSLKDELEG